MILRNFEGLPDKFLDHDIDILTDNVKNMSYIINEDEHSTEKASIKIGDKKILIDFRYHMGHHYDEKWSKDILRRRILHKGGFYVPSKEDHFYTLLYHAIFHKKLISPEYKNTILRLAKTLEKDEISEELLDDFELSKKFIEEYMKNMNYRNPTSLNYRLKNNEFTRLFRLSLFLLKTEGSTFLIREFYGKISRIISHQN